MIKKVALVAALAAALSMNVQAAEDKSAEASSFIGVINMPFIMNEIPQAKASMEALQKEFGPREAELQKIETDGKALEQTLPTLKGDQLVDTQRKLAQMQADFNLKLRALQEDRQKRAREEKLKLSKMIQKAIDAIAKERGLQLVIRGEDVAVFVTKGVNISDEVIKRVSKQNDKAPAKK